MMFSLSRRFSRRGARPHAPNDPSSASGSASEPLRTRVLAGVRGVPPSPSSGHLDRGPRIPLAATVVTLLVGIAIGGALALSLFSADHGAATDPQAPGSIRASLAPLGSRAELTVSGMPEPHIGEIYEVWLVNKDHPAPQPTDALFNVTSTGSATVDVPGGARSGVREVLVTSEPLGGSETPTGPAVLRVRAPSTR